MAPLSPVLCQGQNNACSSLEISLLRELANLALLYNSGKIMILSILQLLLFTRVELTSWQISTF